MTTRSSLIQKTDAELLEAWGAGDRAAGGALLDRHFDPLHRFFINKVHEDAVSDLAQDSLLTCVKSRGNFRSESSFRTFLLGIARHQLLHHYRRQKRKEGRLDLIDPQEESANSVLDPQRMSSLLVRRREQALILAALRTIPIDYQVVLELFFWEDLTARECAAILEIGLGAVKGRLQRAKRALRKALEQAEAPPADKASVTKSMGEWIMGIHDFILAGSPKGAAKLREWETFDDAEIEAAQA